MLSIFCPSEGTVICWGRQCPLTYALQHWSAGESVSLLMPYILTTALVCRRRQCPFGVACLAYKSCIAVWPQQWPVEGDSTSLLLQVEHAAQSCIAVRPLYLSVERDSIPLLLPALLRLTSTVVCYTQVWFNWDGAEQCSAAECLPLCRPPNVFKVLFYFGRTFDLVSERQVFEHAPCHTFCVL